MAAQTPAPGTDVGDFEHLGEFAMNRMAGSLELHGAMNERMRSVLGADDEERMHVLMGRRYAGCASSGSVGPMMGPGMMGGRGWSRKHVRVRPPPDGLRAYPGHKRHPHPTQASSMTSR